MMIFGGCVQTLRRRWRPDAETQVQTIPKQVFRIQLQPREQIVEVPNVLHFEQLVENPQL